MHFSRVEFSFPDSSSQKSRLAATWTLKWTKKQKNGRVVFKAKHAACQVQAKQNCSSYHHICTRNRALDPSNSRNRFLKNLNQRCSRRFKQSLLHNNIFVQEDFLLLIQCCGHNSMLWPSLRLKLTWNFFIPFCKIYQSTLKKFIKPVKFDWNGPKQMTSPNLLPDNASVNLLFSWKRDNESKFTAKSAQS